jgi:hypothetical protein
MATTLCLCSDMSIGMISIFSMLNFAPDILHQLSRTFSMCLKLSSLLRYRLVLSANSFITSYSAWPGTCMPCIPRSFLILQASGSIAMSKSGHERGLPCHTPLVTRYGSLLIPFIITTVWAFLYSALTVFVKG